MHREKEKHWSAVATASLDHALQTPQEAVRLRDSLTGNRVGTLLFVGNSVDAEIIGVAGRAAVSDIAIGEDDADSVSVV